MLSELSPGTINSHAVQGGITRPAGKLRHAAYLGWPQEPSGLLKHREDGRLCV